MLGMLLSLLSLLLRHILRSDRHHRIQGIPLNHYLGLRRRLLLNLLLMGRLWSNANVCCHMLGHALHHHLLLGMLLLRLLLWRALHLHLMVGMRLSLWSLLF